jgi:hypothetical protein
MKNNNWLVYTLFAFFLLIGIYLIGFPFEKAEKRLSLEGVIKQQMVFQKYTRDHAQQNLGQK